MIQNLSVYLRVFKNVCNLKYIKMKEYENAKSEEVDMRDGS